MNISALRTRSKFLLQFQWVLIALLSVVLFASGLSLVLSLHYTRLYSTQLQLLEYERDELYIQWTKLLLEQSVIASDKMIDGIAMRQLQMHTPEMKEIIMVKP